LARDRVGIRPLFYSINNGCFYFCSEIKGIFENQEIPKTISSTGLSQIFTFWTTINSITPFENIYEVPPGNYMVVNSQGTRTTKYWELKFPKEDTAYNITINEAKERFRELFRDAVRIRLIADVQVAAYLSGGIDSSVTTAFIKEIEPEVLNTFSIGFKDKVFDETDFQTEASEYLIQTILHIHVHLRK